RRKAASSPKRPMLRRFRMAALMQNAQNLKISIGRF
ncbi:MAG: hypothetical protein ACI9PU_002401, partial [Ascidiaceihabitans sp.]